MAQPFEIRLGQSCITTGAKQERPIPFANSDEYQLSVLFQTSPVIVGEYLPSIINESHPLVMIGQDSLARAEK
jgi:hypothetical protein